MNKLNAYLNLIRFYNPIGFWLLLWPGMWGLFMSDNFEIKHFAIVLVGAFLTRSLGCAINDYFDMEFDGCVQRTKDRPLVTGIVKPSEALILFFFLIFLSGLLLNWMNWLTIKVAAFGLVLATFYPLTKRFFAIPQFFLGLAFSWGILMVSAAELNRINYISQFKYR